MKNLNLKLWLCAMMLCTVTSAKAHDFEVDGIYYNITSSTAPLTVAVTYRGSYADEYSYEYTGSVTIPESVTTYNGNSYSVTSIDDYAFFDCSGLTSVTIPNSVTSIGSYAFFGCSGLTSVEIPNSVTSIGDEAFCFCSSLAFVAIPNSVTEIGGYAFGNTAWYVNQPDGMVYAGKVAYKYKGAMPEGTEIVLEEGTLGIAGSAFSSCTGLTSVTIPNSVTSIGGSAFYGCI